MQESINDITEQVMGRIHREKIKMRPRIFFIAGSILTFLGLVLSMVSSAFMISILHLSLREGGRMATYKLETLQSLFHWWIPVIAILGMVIGIWLLKYYEFSYKKNFLYVAIGLVLAVIISGFLLDLTKFNETMVKKGNMHDIVKPWQTDGSGLGKQSGPRDGTGRGSGGKP